MAQLIINIPNAVVNEYLDDFIRANPIPVDEAGLPEFTPSNWARERIIIFLRNEIRRGKTILRDRTNSVNFTGDDIA